MPIPPAPTARWSDEKLRLIDVGGAGGLQDKWLPVAQQITPVLFEPNPAEAALLRTKIAQQVSSGLVMETGLFNVTGPRNLNVTAFFGCTSLREPNPEVLGKYRINPAFRVVGTEPVHCTRYDTLYFAGEVPQPDAIKIDVQGCEYEVLQGFGGLLQDCLGIELETHVYPMYKDQKLMHDVIAYLADFGFVLRRLNTVPSFDGDVIEMDAWFTKSAPIWRSMPPLQQKKTTLLCDVWDLVDYRRIDPHAHHNQIEPR